jgi:hypothetical protein
MKTKTYYISVFSNVGDYLFSTEKSMDLSKSKTLFKVFCNRFNEFEVVLYSVKTITDKECRTCVLKRKLYWKDKSTTI